MGGYRRLLEYTLLPMLPEAERRVRHTCIHANIFVYKPTQTHTCVARVSSPARIAEADAGTHVCVVCVCVCVVCVLVPSPQVPGGGLAVLYDKNAMETWGYACALAQLTNEPVHLVRVCLVWCGVCVCCGPHPCVATLHHPLQQTRTHTHRCR
jgi:hypothetical protein